MVVDALDANATSPNTAKLSTCRSAPGFSPSASSRFPSRSIRATRDQRVRFNLIHNKCGNRVQNQWFCQVDNEVVPREDLVRAARLSKERYVQITYQEFGARSEANRMIDVKEFVPLESVDPVYFETAIISDPTKAEKNRTGSWPARKAGVVTSSTRRCISSRFRSLLSGQPLERTLHESRYSRSENNEP